MSRKKPITSKEQLRDPLTIEELPGLISVCPTQTEMDILNTCYDQGMGAVNTSKQLFKLCNSGLNKDEVSKLFHAIEAERSQRYISKCDPNNIDSIALCDQAIAIASGVSDFWLNRDNDTWLRQQDNARKWILLKEQIANKQLQMQAYTQNNQINIIEESADDRREAIKRLLPSA